VTPDIAGAGAFAATGGVGGIGGVVDGTGDALPFAFVVMI
jgi:hypothetical protein